MADDAAGTGSVPPPPPPPPAAPPTGQQRKTGMLVLAYLGLLALIPLLVEKDDREVQWHAKHGLVLFGLFFVLYTGIFFMGALLSLFYTLAPLASLAWFVVTIVAIVKAVNGQRFVIPGISNFADRF